MKTRQILIAAIGIASILMTCIAVYSRSLLRTEASIRASLLEQMPLGSKAENVRTWVEQAGWLDHQYNGSSGYLRQESGRPGQIVGVTSICGHLGTYYAPLRVDVTVFWGFDVNGRLIDVWVWKTIDSV